MAIHSRLKNAQPFRIVACLLTGLGLAASSDNLLAQANVFDKSPVESMINQFCIDCHSDDEQQGNLNLDALQSQTVERGSNHWELVLKRLRARQMPPSSELRPTEKDYRAAMDHLAEVLDRTAAENPNPGRTETFRRLNRFEYENAIRDLLALDIDAQTLLPADESSHGFDNITVGDLPPTLLTRYINAAQKISRLAIGAPRKNLEGHTYRIPADVTQEKHVPGLPLGTRGGTLLQHTFPREGEYEVHVNLTRDRNELVEGLNEPHEVEFLLDKRRVAQFTVTPPTNKKNYFFDDEQLKARIQVTAGPHDLGITFVKNRDSLLETKRQPLNAHFNVHRHPRLTPAVYQISITGPFPTDAKPVPTRGTPNANQPRLNTPSRRRIFVAYPTQATDEETSAKRIIANLTRRAYRRPITEIDLERPMEFFRQASSEHGFEAGIEMALSSILVSPRFLFRVEREPVGIEPGTVYTISDLELATRLSFFLWSSIPDDELLGVAERGEIRKPDVFKQQMLRMLKDSRSRSLVTNFASQWLYLRNLDSRTPDARLFPDFDDNLRQAFRQETELFFESVVREDRPIIDLLKSDYTFLNERLAKHYGIPHVYGSRFRRVAVSPESHRGGLLRHGSILTVTSYATRTSPVIRGNWILVNILGTPIPPPPANVPALDDNVIAAKLTVRERLAQHRADPACASCHDIMDPVGFALENFDAVGRWRETEAGKPVDVSAGLPDGSRFSGVAGLEAGLLEQPEMFATALTEKLFTYALGRGVEHSDGPAIRQVVREAGDDDYRFSSIIWGIINSPTFQTRLSR